MELSRNAGLCSTSDKAFVRLAIPTCRLSHDLLNFWDKFQAEFSTSGLDNYAALYRQVVDDLGLGGG